MPLTDKDRRIAYSIVRHLEDQVQRGDLPEDAVEGIMVAQQCLCAAYEIDLSVEEDRAKYEIRHTLEELFDNSKCMSESSEATSTHTCTPAASETTSEDVKQKAEEFKNQGNSHLKLNRFEEAVDCYGKAIKLDPSNATYFCNRAAAYIKISEFQKALDDCKVAISLNPSYARAYGRMGYVYSLLEKPKDSRDCFKKAIELDPDNENYKSNLETVEQQLMSDAPPGAEGSSGGASGGPQMPPPPGGFPGFGGLASMMQNPAFMNMATTLMSNPSFQNFAGRMMSQGGVPNPSNIASMMPNVTEAAQEMQRNNPQAFETLRQQASQFATSMGQAGMPPQPPPPPAQQDKPDKQDE